MFPQEISATRQHSSIMPTVRRGGCAWMEGTCMAEGGIRGWGHAWLSHTHPHLCGQTDTCKNITFPQLRLRTVIKYEVNNEQDATKVSFSQWPITYLRSQWYPYFDSGGHLPWILTRLHPGGSALFTLTQQSADLTQAVEWTHNWPFRTCFMCSF